MVLIFLFLKNDFFYCMNEKREIVYSGSASFPNLRLLRPLSMVLVDGLGEGRIGSDGDNISTPHPRLAPSRNVPVEAEIWVALTSRTSTSSKSWRPVCAPPVQDAVVVACAWTSGGWFHVISATLSRRWNLSSLRCCNLWVRGGLFATVSLFCSNAGIWWLLSIQCAMYILYAK